MIRRLIRVLCVCLLVAGTGSGIARGATAVPPQLLRNPAISKTQIAFTYAGNLWTVPRSGGDARLIVSGFNLRTTPYFSPDGRRIAFTGIVDGIYSVYVVPAGGGEPKRLTTHPAAAFVAGWTPDGKDVLFRSDAGSATDPDSLFTVPAAGGFPTRVPLAMAESGSYSADGTHLAYVPNFRVEPFWKGYRGGETTPILIADLADSSIIRVPRDNSNDDTPMWIGKTIYFLSDRNGPVTLFAYDTQSRRVERVLANDGFDITAASAGPDAIVYAQFGDLHVYDLATHASTPLNVNVAADLPEARPHYTRVNGMITNADISPTGVRAVFEAFGQIFTVPGEHGDIRNISAAPHTANRDPSWSPDGKWIAYFSDAGGEYTLDIRDQRGLLPPRVIQLGPSPSFFYTPVWSPDSKMIAYSDKHLNLYYLEIAHPVPVKVATALSDGFGAAAFEVSWSPDSRWLAYINELPNFLHGAFIYNIASHTSRRVSDGLSDIASPTFDNGGKYLYLAASTNTALTSQGLDMTADQQGVSSSIYAIVLKRDVPSPVNLQSDEEVPPKTAAPASDEPEGATVTRPLPSPSPSPAPSAAAVKRPAVPPAAVPPVEIDFDGIAQRIVALPIPAANFVGIYPSKPGEMFLVQAPAMSNEPGPTPLTVTKFDLTTRKVTPFVSGATAFALSANGAKALYSQGPRWFLTVTSKPADGTGALDLSTMELYSDPREDWRQMYHEVWRIERDFFYDPHYHGLDIAAAEKRFEPYLASVGSRDDLNFLFEEMLSYLSVGHMFVRGGAPVPMPHVNVGLLGADYAIENGRYRITKIYNGENWNPSLHAPLTQPGANVNVGDYLLAVNGRSLRATDDLYAAFMETGNKQTVLRVSKNADGTAARDVTVVPVVNDFALRNRDWIESNRRKVDELSGGKLGYIYLPDTAFGGYTNFNRYYFSQVGKQGLIIDERFNHGGQIADYILDYLSRKPISIIQGRDGKAVLDPPLSIYGPKVMLINEFAGSGGDALPWYFKKEHLGTLVGTRTWGGLVGIGGYPSLIDGGTVTAPRSAIGGLNGSWEVENHGVAPDIDVFQDPKLVREGHDPQLEAGVKRALELLREHPVPTFTPPPFPNHHPVLPN